MSPHWLKFLEKFGYPLRSAPELIDHDELRQHPGDPELYERYDVLFRLYGPLEDSPWLPYHCPTMFAIVQKGYRPSDVELSDVLQREYPSDAWQWLGKDTMVVVDLPGPTAIEVGALLMKQGAQFVSTFDHWPMSPSVGCDAAVEACDVLDTMYTLAPQVHSMRKQLDADAPPVWLCDHRRMAGSSSPSPGTFDNRYYIDDSLLPGTELLQKQEIRRLVLLTDRFTDLRPDLVPFVREANDAGLNVERVGLEVENTWAQPEPMEQMPFETNLPIKGFRRSDMGGFGKEIPKKTSSSGSYSSGRRGG